MKNSQQPYQSGFFEHNERVTPPVEAGLALQHTTAEQTQLNTLLDTGFMWEEAIKLISLREHLHENKEMRQRMTDDYRMHFVRWLYQSGEICDDDKK